ncbi:uncharacterized protein [Montipora foliosa]|uniref:uncharacterized protein n=1 Tax=Montipora foliosa TaxID=591990 RepID=UPI0035F1E23C
MEDLKNKAVLVVALLIGCVGLGEGQTSLATSPVTTQAGPSSVANHTATLNLPGASITIQSTHSSAVIPTQSSSTVSISSNVMGDRSTLPSPNDNKDDNEDDDKENKEKEKKETAIIAACAAGGAVLITGIFLVTCTHRKNQKP